ncbi:hypothetical protein ACOJQI_10965 [Bacillus salacetis]|uniref:hypothetical protein n=1 Tax=Bacillus salacetis TaxID=2315464 RepID=UPI003BA285D9
MVSLIVLILLLSACSGNEKIRFEDKSFASTLMIQKVENSTSSEEMTTIVTDQEKIKNILTMIEDLEVKNIKVNTFMETLTSKTSYMFVFFEEGRSAEKAEFAFYILEDGTILFNSQESRNPGKPLIGKEKQLDILNEMKQTLEIDF